MNIRLATQEDRQVWDSYVETHANASPYHLYAWKYAVEESYGLKGYYLLALEDNDVVGVLPLVEMGIPFCRKKIVSLPYCDVGGVLTDNQEIAHAMLEKSLALAEERQWSGMELRAGDTTPEMLQLLSHKSHTVSNKVRMILDLPESSEVLWKSFKSKLRSQVRKAEKNGLSFQFSGNVDDFYHVFSLNMRDLGSPVHARKWIDRVIHHYGEKAKMGLVYKDELPVGAGILLRAGNKISIPWASTLRQYNRLSPNMLLYWKSLEYAADSGAESFDFGRSTLNEGTYRFKAQWGAKPLPLEWHEIFLQGDVPSTSSGSSQTRDRVAGMWGKMPLGLANFVGPKIRKFISL